jgi:hypothetical protein
MKIFISWSGERSKALAHALRDWLPLVLHYVVPWLSEADIEAGERWATEVATELEVSNFGLVCITPENLNAPWILFESGALAKSMSGARVVPFLFQLEFSDISGPLAQFQAKKVAKAGVEEVVSSINKACDQSIPQDRVRQLFEALWPELEKRLEAIPPKATSARHARPQHEILEELVASVRGFDSRFQNLENVVDSSNTRNRKRRPRRMHPGMIEELMFAGGEGESDPISLLIVASLYREEMPWFYELASEVYREFKNGDPKARAAAARRMRRFLHVSMRGPFLDAVGDPESHMALRELPFLIDHFLNQLDPEASAADRRGPVPPAVRKASDDST